MLKWVSGVLCALIVGLWVLSVLRPPRWFGSRWLFESGAGCVVVIHLDVRGTDARLAARIERDLRAQLRAYPPDKFPRPVSGGSFGLVLPTVTRVDPLKGGPRRLFSTVRAFVTSIRMPLWVPFVVIAVPTALLWWRDHRPPKGHCQSCAYDLTGNVSGRCPECGTMIEGAALPRATERP